MLTRIPASAYVADVQLLGVRATIPPSARMANLHRLGAALEALLQRSGLRSQAALARKAGLATTVVNRAFKGHNSPSIENLDAMLTGMGMTFYDLAAALEDEAGEKSTYPGRVRPLWLERLVGRGHLNDDILWTLAVATRDETDNKWAPDFKETVAEVGRRLAAQAISELETKPVPILPPPKKKK